MILVLLPAFLRKELRRIGALIVSALTLISPTTLYYARYIRNDIYMMVWALLMAIANATLVAGPAAATASSVRASSGSRRRRATPPSSQSVMPETVSPSPTTWWGTTSTMSGGHPTVRSSS